MKTIEVKTAELEGVALDWAVAKASGMPFYTQGEDWPGNYRVTHQAGEEPVIIRALIGSLWVEFQGKTTPWSPSTDWSQGGPLIDKYRLEIVSDGSLNEGWRCVKDWCYGEVIDVYPLGETPLIAACRAIVAAKLGDVVQVPADLIGTTV